MYKLAKLPYDYEELEPFIDTHTLGLHHKKHQQNYLNKLNEILVKNNYDFKYNLVELNFHIDEFPKDVQENLLFNLGGVINHDIYFNSMSKNKTSPSLKFISYIICRLYPKNNIPKMMPPTMILYHPNALNPYFCT